ncbi:MAG: class I SAM-dependent methyltransferase [Luteimonas sp.]
MTGHDVKYQFEVNLDNLNNGHSLLHALVVEDGKPAMDILEIGCSSGYVGATFIARGHRVTGIELDPDAARAAGAVLDEVYCGDVDAFFEAHPERRFDAILLGDVLEHLVDPRATLRRCVTHLRAGGMVAISLPCVTHGSIRAMLLDGRWDYADYGLLDRTHLRFFSRHGMAELVSGAGLDIDRLFAVTMSIDDAAREYGMTLQQASIAAVETLAQDDDLHTFQFVVRARPAEPALAYDELLSRNLSLPLQRIGPQPRVRGNRSLRVRMFRALLGGIAARRFRKRTK